MFSAPGVQDPAAVLRLLILLAGDIESNPGPTIQSRKCDSCTKAIRQPKPPATNKSPPLHCKQIDCTNVCHRIPKCSKVSRYTIKPTWLCTLYNPNTPPPPPTSACACSLTPANPPANACSPSTNHACPTRTPDDAPNDAPKRKCFKCKGPIRIDHTPLYCSHCKRPFHGKCTKLTRDAIAAAKLTPNSWTCNRCISILAPIASPADPNSIRSVSERVQKSCKPSLKIVQWNADGLKTKIYELKD